MATKTSKALFIVLSLVLVSSALALSSRREEEERRELEQCKQECRQQPHYDQGLRRRCESRCEEKQQQEKERGGRDDDDESLNSHRQDPEQRLEQCKVSCCTHCGQRSQCLQRCQQEYEEEKRREHGRDESRQDPEKRLEQCKEKCRQRRQGQQQQWQCERQCQQEYEEEKSRQGGRDEGRQEEAERRFEQCKDQCRRQGREGEPRRWDCEQQCRQKYEEERGRQQGRDSSKRDPKRKLEECRQECRERHQGQKQEQLQCQHRCQQRYEQEQQEQGRDETRRDPQERLEECRRDCRQQEGQQQQKKCEQECQKEYKEEQQRQQGRGGERDDINPQREEEEEQGKTGRNPYVFQQESFMHRVRSEHGSIRILRNFAQKSKLLLGIANYRIAMLEADPNTFVVPHHFDADTLFYVVRGEGTITLIKGNQDRESHNIRQGDILKVSAGTIVYLINRSNNQKLNIAKILNPVSIPGQVEEFYTVGGQQPESYYRVFSNDLLEAALNTRRDQLERLFGQQRQGVIIKASQEQIREMSRHSSSEHGGHWPFGGESRGPYNLLNKRPTHSNQHGRLYEVDCNDYQPLRALNIQVSLANITGGSMVAPFFNSKATKIAIVTEGRGYFEMVCPHLSQQQGGQGQRGEQEQEQEEEEGQQQQGRRYEKVRSQVSKNTVFIVPPGHPVAIVADRNQNLEVLCFEVNAENNRRAFVAGKNNVVSKMEREAKELAFGVPSKLVDEVFSGRQQEEMFVRGPQSSQQEKGEEERRRQPLNSILEFAAGF